LKNTVFIIAGLLFLFSIQIEAQNNFEWIKEGTKLRYYLHDYGRDYEFIVDITGLSNGIEFNWWMTQPANNKGQVRITERAMESATTQQNYFSGGYDEMDNRTTVWVCRDVWKALKDGGGIVIKPEGIDETLSYVSDYDYLVKIDGEDKVLKTLYAEGNHGDKYWILDDPDNPIILKMVVSFNIEIGEIMTREYWEE